MLYEYDGTDDKCPLALVKTRVMLKKMGQGDRGCVRIADPGSKINIPQYLAKAGIRFQQREINEQIIELQIEL